MPRIAVDAMGSDAAPRVEVEGVVAALRARRGIDVLLVGDEARLRAELKALGAEDARIEVRHAPEVITMHDAPSMAVKQKKKSSMRVCFDMVKAGEADAVVSAGNSGAMMACGLLVLGRLPGVERPAIVTTFPTRAGECALLDMGANVDPKPAVLAQFGVLGSVYARLLHGKARPRVGLLSNGSEEHKGTALTRDAHQILARVPEGDADFSYLGYVEGRDIFEGQVDVVVTDGFTGNVLLKCVEGAGETMLGMVKEEVTRSGLLAKIGAALMTSALKRLRKRIDYAEHGGAPLLGVDGVALICHGGSSATALENAVYVADRFAQLGLGKELAAAVARHAFVSEGQPAVAPGAEALP
ncbi:MAG TPA: phosphate acyltransferase PlsX [Polyangia bacterium]|jgi:glycerol-3-phosphate acyltransferase PlsX|nr:phosphate acyltransferase PlsX [Polyangia bacterium]